MTYQFDPRPEGLHYEPLHLSCLTKTVWWLRDGAPHLWFDMRSLVEALGMSWAHKWQAAFRLQSRAWRLEACCDKRMRETMLAPDYMVVQILHQLLAAIGGHAAAAQRIRAAAAAWPRVRHELLTGAALAAPKAAQAPAKGGNRKVSAFAVRQIHKALMRSEPKPVISKALGLSTATINQVASGRYKLDEEGMAAWRETFGANPPPPSLFTGCKRRQIPANANPSLQRVLTAPRAANRVAENARVSS